MVSLLVAAPVMMLRSRRRFQFLAMFIAIALVVRRWQGAKFANFFGIQV
jgi:hypothetical protein